MGRASASSPSPSRLRLAPRPSLAGPRSSTRRAFLPPCFVGRLPRRGAPVRIPSVVPRGPRPSKLSPRRQQIRTRSRRAITRNSVECSWGSAEWVAPLACPITVSWVAKRSHRLRARRVGSWSVWRGRVDGEGAPTGTADWCTGHERAYVDDVWS